MYIPMLSPTVHTVSIRYGAEFKTRGATACEQAWASIADMALANGIDANRVHHRIRERRHGVVGAFSPGRIQTGRGEPLRSAMHARIGTLGQQGTRFIVCQTRLPDEGLAAVELAV
jgi:hypothetical protein